MKKNNDHTALEMHEEEFDFFKISKPKKEPETHQEASEQEPTLKSVLLEPIKNLHSNETKESLIELLDALKPLLSFLLLIAGPFIIIFALQFFCHAMLEANNRMELAETCNKYPPHTAIGKQICSTGEITDEQLKALIHEANIEARARHQATSEENEEQK